MFLHGYIKSLKGESNIVYDDGQGLYEESAQFEWSGALFSCFVKQCNHSNML
jgi:hypothetical protein